VYDDTDPILRQYSLKTVDYYDCPCLTDTLCCLTIPNNPVFKQLFPLVKLFILYVCSTLRWVLIQIRQRPIFFFLLQIQIKFPILAVGGTPHQCHGSLSPHVKQLNVHYNSHDNNFQVYGTRTITRSLSELTGINQENNQV
jgi:hypothetical protein